MTSTHSHEAERADLIRSLAVVCERPGRGSARVAAALGIPSPGPMAHTDLFVHQLPPYASIYLGREGKIGGEAQDRIAGFWRAVGISPPAEPDHLAALLGLWARLLGEAAGADEEPSRALALHAGRVLAWEHLASWLIPYLLRVEEIADDPFRAWAGMLRSAVDTHGDQVSDLPAHLVDDPAPATKPDDLVPFLLAPLRSGIILARADLTRSATALGLGMRIGERAFAMRALLGQAPGPVIDWMAAEARRQSRRLGDRGAVRAAWARRARRTASVLDGLAGTPE